MLLHWPGNILAVCQTDLPFSNLIFWFREVASFCIGIKVREMNAEVASCQRERKAATCDLLQGVLGSGRFDGLKKIPANQLGDQGEETNDQKQGH